MVAKSERLAWPDAAKGFCIFLVVLVHLTTKQYVVMDWPIPSVIQIGWEGLSRVLTPIRMPLFFAISGYFVAKYLDVNWRNVARPRLFSPYYLYLVWFVIHTLLYALNLPIEIQRADGVAEFGLGLIFGYTSLWYLYALPVYFGIVKLCSRMPLLTVSTGGVVSAVVSTNVFPMIGNSPSLFENFVYFSCAALYPRLLAGLADRVTGPRAASLLGGFLFCSVGLIGARVLVDSPPLIVELVFGVVGILVGFAGITAGVFFFAWAEAVLTLWTKIWAYVGRRTLPIYVMHLPVIGVMNIFLSQVSPPVVMLVIYPILASVVVVVVCLSLERVLRIAGAGWLFQMPTFSRRANSNHLRVEQSSLGVFERE